MLLDRLTKQISIVFIASTVTNIANYLFHVFMSRTLGPSNYAVLASLVSIFFIVSIPAATIQTAIAKYTSHFRAQNKYGKIKLLLSGSLKKLSLAGIGVFVIFVLGSPYIASFLKISSTIPVIIIGASLSFAFVLPSPLGILQGLQRFGQFGTNLVVQSFSKLLVGILLVYVGLGVSGALSAFAISFLAGLVIALILLASLFHQGNLGDDINFSEIYRYCFPVLITILCFTLLTNIDVVLVKRFFASSEAGYYAAASIVSKIIIYLPGAIGIVMFPRASELHSLKQDTISVLRRSLFYTALLCGVATLGYFAFPSLIVRVIFGKEYLAAIPLIGLFGLAMYFFSLTNILLMYQLSIHRLAFVKTLIMATVLEVVLIILFHQTLTQVILSLLLVSLFLFFVNIYYVFTVSKKKVSTIFYKRERKGFS